MAVPQDAAPEANQMEENELFERFTAEMTALQGSGDGLALRRLANNAEIVISPLAVWMLIAQLQLALRHPHNDGESAGKMARLLDWLRGEFIRPGSAMEQVFIEGSEGK